MRQWLEEQWELRRVPRPIIMPRQRVQEMWISYETALRIIEAIAELAADEGYVFDTDVVRIAERIINEQ